MSAPELQDPVSPSWDLWEQEARETRRRRIRLSLALLFALSGWGLAFFWERVQLFFEPQPSRIWIVASQAGSVPARAGRLELGVGERFDLYAVLEARTWYRRKVYFSEAQSVELPDGQMPKALQQWSDGVRRARVRWHSLEPRTPYLEVSSSRDLERLELVPAFRSELGSGWSVRGLALDPRKVWVEEGIQARPLGCGVERFALRFEVFEGRDALAPALRLESPGFGGVLPADGAEAAWVEVGSHRPEPLAEISARLGVPQIELMPAIPQELLLRIADLERRGWLVEPGLIWDRLRRRFGRVAWRSLSLEAGLRGAQVSEGDWLEFPGSVLAVVWTDRDPAGVLGPQDLIWMWSRGGRLLSLGTASSQLGAPKAWLPLASEIGGSLSASAPERPKP